MLFNFIFIVFNSLNALKSGEQLKALLPKIFKAYEKLHKNRNSLLKFEIWTSIFMYSVFAPKTIKTSKMHEKHGIHIYIDFLTSSFLVSTIAIFKSYESLIYNFSFQSYNQHEWNSIPKNLVQYYQIGIAKWIFLLLSDFSFNYVLLKSLY